MWKAVHSLQTQNVICAWFCQKLENDAQPTQGPRYLSLVEPKHNLDKSKTKFINKLLGQALNME